MEKSYFKWKYVNGLKQIPKDTDFHITPVLTFGRAKVEEGSAWGICIQWGHWAYGFGVYTLSN